MVFCRIFPGLVVMLGKPSAREENVRLKAFQVKEKKGRNGENKRILCPFDIFD